MTIEDRILDALAVRCGIGTSALAMQWVRPESTYIGHFKAITEAVKRLTQQGAIYKSRGKWYLKNLTT